MTMRMAVVNQKGGVGKTTTTVNLAAALALRGRKILVVDLDPQANATTGIGIDHRALERSVYDVIIDGFPAREAIVSSAIPGLDVLPSAIDLAGAELELVPAMARESKLKNALADLDEYDLILIDCPPSIGLLTVNALTAAEKLLVPIQCEYYALEGLSQLISNVDRVRAGLNSSLEIGSIVLTMYDGRTNLSEQVAAEVRTHFGDLVAKSVVPRSVRLSEAPSFGQPAVTLDPAARGSMSYRWLAEELDLRLLTPPASANNAKPVNVAPDSKPTQLDQHTAPAARDAAPPTVVLVEPEPIAEPELAREPEPPSQPEQADKTEPIEEKPGSGLPGAGWAWNVAKQILSRPNDDDTEVDSSKLKDA